VWGTGLKITSMIRKRLIWQLVPAFLLITLMALIPLTLSASSIFRSFYLERTRDELRLLASATAIQVAQVLEGPVADIDGICKRLGQADDGRMRVTVILPGGDVIGDSERDPAKMDDHSNRPEIMAAMRSGEGSEQRMSPTLGTNMMYVAVAIQPEDDVRAVVRTAIATSDIERALQVLYTRIFWNGVVVVLCATGLSVVVARRISRPIEGMQRVAAGFAKGELTLRVPIPDTVELQSLARALNKMARQLSDRIQTITSQRNEAGAILSSMIEGVIAVDAEGRIVSANRAAAELLDIDAADAQGRYVEEVIRDVGLQDFVRKILTGQHPEEVNIALPLHGGRFFQVHGVRLEDAPEIQSGAVVVLHDMTRIHRLETIRRDFVANVSHELKTPITSIKGFVEALLDGDLADAEQVAYYLRIVEKHADRLNAIIDDLLTLSRLEEDADQPRISLEIGSVRAVLESALELSCIKAGEKGIRLQLDCADDIQARLSAPLLEQAVVNLVDNAIKYSDPGTTVFVSGVKGDDGVAIVVRDIGCGIPQEHLSRLFERFYVVDRGRSRKLGGTGLGLAIVKHITQVHGGTVTVESQPGIGTNFTIRIPTGVSPRI